MPVMKKITSTDISGASPPAVFVGRAGYPKVNVGLLVPQLHGNTSILDAPSLWCRENYSIKSIIESRSELVNASFVSSVKSPARFVGLAQEIALSKRSVEMEVSLKGIPKADVSYDSTHTPMGPQGRLNAAKLSSNPATDQKMEYLASDSSANATDAMLELYASGIDTNAISKLLSVGLLGAKTQRKLVPTRWSITAVDDTLGKRMIEEVKSFDWVDSYKLFFNSYLGNSFAVLLMPRFWSFELIEAYYPGSVWLMQGERKMISDYETNLPRKGYADSTGGAYYAIRLAVLEYLKKIRKQASALILREVGSDYYAPLGVWVTRETVRNAFSSELSFASFSDAVAELEKRMKTSKEDLLAKSALLSDSKRQRTLRDF